MDTESGTSDAYPEGGAASPPRPGDIVLPGGFNASEPLVGTGSSTPMEEDEPEGTIPPCPLWAMKERRHVQWHLLASHERHARLRDVVGEGDDAVYVIDDGPHHVMLGRRVGEGPDGCAYCLLGRDGRDAYEALRRGQRPLATAFDTADELTLCGVVVEQDVRSSNIFDVERYDAASDVPAPYRAGAPYLRLDEDLDPS